MILPLDVVFIYTSTTFGNMTTKNLSPTCELLFSFSSFYHSLTLHPLHPLPPAFRLPSVTRHYGGNENDRINLVLSTDNNFLHV